MVDDTMANLKAIARLVQSYGLNCSMAQSGKAALDILQGRIDRGEQTFNLVLLDI